jgi:hypothetical protein
MLDRAQLEEIRTAMETEHQRDREALERLMRFLPPNGVSPHFEVRTGSAAATTYGPSERPVSILGGIEWILESNPNRTWTVRKIHDELLKRGYSLEAKNPIATIGVAVKKLCDRDRVKVLRRGSGREPSIYQFLQKEPALAEEAEETTS